MTGVDETEGPGKADGGTVATIRVPVPFESLVAIVRQLDGEHLRALRRVTDEALSERDSVQQGTATDWPDAQPEAAIERSHAATRESREAQAMISQAWHKVLKEWGVEGLEPIGAERLRQMIMQDGVREEDNTFSREIIAMREE